MKDRLVAKCKVELQDRLMELRRGMEASLAIESGLMGIKVWVLPQRYFRAVYFEREWRRLWYELISNVLGPRFGLLTLTCVGELRGGEPTSPVRPTRWTIGKGLIGEAIFASSKPEDHVREPFSIVNGAVWPADVTKISAKTFRRELPRHLRRGLSQHDMARLKATYNTAVAAALRGHGSTKAFGCVTAHVPRGTTLTEDQIKACSLLLENASASLALTVIVTLKYRPLRDLIDAQSLAKALGPEWCS